MDRDSEMATILITGNTELFTQEACRALAEENKIILAGTAKFSGKHKNIHYYRTLPVEEKFAHLFEVFTFDAVWYVTGYADGGEGAFGEAQQLEQTLAECRRSRVGKLIVLSTVNSQNYLDTYGRMGELLKREYPSSGTFSAAKTEELCQYFQDKTEMCVVTLWLPYVADRVNDKNFLGGVFRNIYEKDKVIFPYHREDRVDFLAMQDLTELLIQITEETEDSSGSYYATSGYRYQYSDLEEMLRLVSPDVQVMYENYPDMIQWPDYPMELRSKYGFVPMENVMENIGSYYRTFINEVVRGRRGAGSRILGAFTEAGKGIFKYIELILVFLIAELIAYYTSDSVYFKFVDVRLLYIVIMGTIYGMRMGIFAALLESAVLVRQYALIGMSGTLLFYNIENWIPFAIYLMAGSITGYIRNKKTDELSFSKQEYALLRDKYIFLNDVYHGAVENKGEYKKQILGFKDSFGKIFDAVQRLDNELPESIFLEGLQVMEDILENHTIAIYSLDDYQRFGRLVVCSSSRLTKLTKSIRLEEYEKMYRQVKGGNVWKNTELIPDMPMYACGVFDGDRIVLLVAIWEASVEQYGMHYMNIFRILCGLVQTSFLRAVEYESLREERLYYPETNVARPERFRQILGVQEDMQEAGVADYVLVRFPGYDQKEISELLAGMVRASDTLGMDEAGNIYLLLVQMNKRNFGIVGERLDSKGLQYQLVEKVG